MGVVFLEHMDGLNPINCAVCGINLTDEAQIISQDFHGATGPACLVNKAVNVLKTHKKMRDLITGTHIVRDVYCKRCLNRLGWYYEYAYNDCQRYKEGKFILEKALYIEGYAI